MPDEEFISRRYLLDMKKPLDLKCPGTFNEKLQWLKIHDRRPEYTVMVDKIQAKKYVSEIIGEDYIIPTLGVWEKFDDIDFESLPNRFVLKCNHDSGGLVVVRDKSKLDKKKAKALIEKRLKRNYYYSTREWPYKNVKPLIFAEQYIDNGPNGLVDYKFFNSNGESKFLYISEGLENHSTARISFYDFNGKQLPFKRNDYQAFAGDYILPENFEAMHRISDTLAKRINAPFVRTDFYSVNGRIYFSEITFYPCGGRVPFDPPEWDEKIGEMLDIRAVDVGTP